jgi:FAD/FMN-containing dehydrogenase
MVISLGALNNTTVDPATQLARVEPGEVLGGMYAILFAQGQRAVAAGTCPRCVASICFGCG